MGNRCILVKKKEKEDRIKYNLIVGPCGSTLNGQSLFKYYPQDRNLRWVKNKTFYVTNFGTDLSLDKRKRKLSNNQKWVFFRGWAQSSPSNIFNPNVSPAIFPVIEPVKVPTVSPTKLPTSQPTSSPTDAPTVLPTIDPIKRMLSIVSVDLPTKCMQPEQLKDGAGVELRKCITDENFRLIQGWIFENGQIRFSSSAFKNRCILVQRDNSNIFSGELIIGPCGSPSNEESLFKYYPKDKYLRWVKDKSLYVTNVGTDLVLQSLYVTNVGKNLILSEKNIDTDYRGQQWVFFRGAAQPTPSNIFNPNVSPAIAPVVQPVKVPIVSPTKLPTSQPTSSPTDAPTVLPTIDPIKRMVSIVSVDLPTKCMQPEQLKDGAGVELRKCITNENFRLMQGW